MKNNLRRRATRTTAKKANHAKTQREHTNQNHHSSQKMQMILKSALLLCDGCSLHSGITYCIIPSIFFLLFERSAKDQTRRWVSSSLKKIQEVINRPIMLGRQICVLVAVASYCHQHVSSLSSPVAVTTTNHKILVLGSNGFLGKQIIEKLDDLGIPYIEANRHDVDLTSPEASSKVATLAQGCDAIISTVGSLGTEEDESVNASNGQAAVGAKEAGVTRFVAIGNDPKVRAFSKQVGPLQNYAKGKESSESIIKQNFPSTYTIVQPSFMHGGDEFQLNPPRIPDRIGSLAEDVLGLYPFQSASENLPGVLGLALMAPISRDRVATACINAALGLVQGDLDSRDETLKAASKRPHKEMIRSTDDNNNQSELISQAEILKQQLYELGDCEGDPTKLERAFNLLEQIEDCNIRSPTTDSSLNGRWDFVMDVEADIGTGVVKDILEGNSPIKVVFDLTDLYMHIENNSEIKIFVETKILGTIPIELVLTTNLIPDDSDPTGTTFLEKFQGVELAGKEFPVPDDWQRSRPLEFSFLDDEILIARGNGAEPHYLKKNK